MRLLLFEAAVLLLALGRANSVDDPSLITSTTTIGPIVSSSIQVSTFTEITADFFSSAPVPQNPASMSTGTVADNIPESTMTSLISPTSSTDIFQPSAPTPTQSLSISAFSWSSTATVAISQPSSISLIFTTSTTDIIQLSTYTPEQSSASLSLSSLISSTKIPTLPSASTTLALLYSSISVSQNPASMSTGTVADNIPESTMTSLISPTSSTDIFQPSAPTPTQSLTISAFTWSSTATVAISQPSSISLIFTTSTTDIKQMSIRTPEQSSATLTASAFITSTKITSLLSASTTSASQIRIGESSSIGTTETTTATATTIATRIGETLVASSAQSVPTRSSASNEPTSNTLSPTTHSETTFISLPNPTHETIRTIIETKRTIAATSQSTISNPNVHASSTILSTSTIGGISTESPDLIHSERTKVVTLGLVAAFSLLIVMGTVTLYVYVKRNKEVIKTRLMHFRFPSVRRRNLYTHAPSRQDLDMSFNLSRLGHATSIPKLRDPPQELILPASPSPFSPRNIIPTASPYSQGGIIGSLDRSSNSSSSLKVKIDSRFTSKTSKLSSSPYSNGSSTDRERYFEDLISRRKNSTRTLVNGKTKMLNCSLIRPDSFGGISEADENSSEIGHTMTMTVRVDGREVLCVPAFSIYEFGKDVSVDELLGRGSEAEVFKGRPLRFLKGACTDEFVAVKVFKDNEYFDPDLFYQEVSITHSVSHHKNIVKFYGLFDSGPFGIIMKLYWGDLVKLMEHEDVSSEVAKGLTDDILQAVNVLHKQQLVHFDMKSRNILIDKSANNKYTAVLADFSLSFALASKQDVVLGFKQCERMGFTVQYAHPDLLKCGHLNKVPIDEWSENKIKALDMFAVGVVMWELCERKRAWESFSDSQIIAFVTSGRRLPFFRCGVDIKDLIIMCWDDATIEDVSNALTMSNFSYELPQLYHSTSYGSINQLGGSIRLGPRGISPSNSYIGTESQPGTIRIVPRAANMSKSPSFADLNSKISMTGSFGKGLQVLDGSISPTLIKPTRSSLASVVWGSQSSLQSLVPQQALGRVVKTSSGLALYRPVLSKANLTKLPSNSNLSNV